MAASLVKRSPASLSRAPGQHKQPCRIELGGHVGQHPLDGLEVADRVTECGTFPGIGKALLRHARPIPTAMAATPILPAARTSIAWLNPAVNLAEKPLVGHYDIVQHECNRVAGTEAEFLQDSFPCPDRGYPPVR